MSIPHIALVVGFAFIAVGGCVVVVRFLDRWLPMDEED